MTSFPLLYIAWLAAPAASPPPRAAVIPVHLDASAARLPDIIDEYVLAAVQKTGAFEVIGQDDISAILGFEKQKDLLGCSETSCFAEIGGALGVQKLISIKVAAVDEEWAVTAKLLHLEGTPRVESRRAEFVSGNATALMRALPGIITRMVADAGYVEAEAVVPEADIPPAGAPTPPVPLDAPAAPQAIEPGTVGPAPPPAPSPGAGRRHLPEDTPPATDRRIWRVALRLRSAYGHPVSDETKPKWIGAAIGVGLQLRLSILRIEPNLILPMGFATEPANVFTFGIHVGGQVGLSIAGVVEPFIDAHLRVGVLPSKSDAGFEFTGGADFALGRVTRIGVAVGYKPTGGTQRLLMRLRLYFLL